MTVETLLQRLEGVRQSGAGRWLARCPAHEDRRASLSVREMPDGRTLVNCFGGCATTDVIAAVGLQFSDLFPPRDLREYERGRYVQHRVAFDPLAAMHALAHEFTVVALIAEQMIGGVPMDRPTIERLTAAVGKVHNALDKLAAPTDAPEMKRARRGEGRAA